MKKIAQLIKRADNLVDLMKYKNDRASAESNSESLSNPKLYSPPTLEDLDKMMSDAAEKAHSDMSNLYYESFNEATEALQTLDVPLSEIESYLEKMDKKLSESIEKGFDY